MRGWATLGIASLAVVGACARGPEPATAPASSAGVVVLPSASAVGSASTAPSALGSASAPPEPPPRTNRGSGPEGCFTRAELAARHALVASDREATWKEALRRQGMTSVKLPAYVLSRGHGELRGPPAAPHVEERDVNGKKVRVVVMPPTGGCGDVTGAFEFARTGDAIYAVTRHVTTRRIEVIECGCPGCTCDPVPPPQCGGARIVADTILGYELSPGTSFGGEREVAYVEDWITVSRAIPPQPVCVAPAPPP